MIRVLVADDSPTSRELIATVIRHDQELSLVGQAVDGAQAVSMVQSLRPDVVLMDLQMPLLDGLQATREIMKLAPTPIVVMTSDIGRQSGSLTLQTLQAGALDLVPKPANPFAAGFNESVNRLTQATKTMAGVKVVRHRPSILPTPVSVSSHRSHSQGKRIVAIATSTGGPTALLSVLQTLPNSFSAPILVVQHITRGFTSSLVDWLNSSCSLRVKEASQGERLVGGSVYFAPDDHHLGVAPDGTLRLTLDPPIGGFRPSGNVLFRSAAAAYGPGVLAVILTGMGEDGVEGLRAVRQNGGLIIGQDEASSVIYGMPGAAAAAGVVDLVVPLEQIGRQILNAFKTQSPDSRG